MADEVERIWQELVLASFVVLLQHAWREAYSVSAGFQVSWWWFM
jgi:hypothetical protein